MAKVRAKVEVEPVIKDVEPTKVRLVTIEIEKKTEDKKSVSDTRFEKHKAFGDLIKRNEINEKVKLGLLRWSFYGLESDTGYHYYLKIKK
jgi:hypothetical protein